MLKCPACGEDNPRKFKLCGFCGTPLAASSPALPAREIRKTVTILFTDLVDSTALGERLDSEALHEVKERYFSVTAAEIARHGGKVEKYIGDAVMAVFGLPRAHEDDALRAVRAAAGLRSALERVNEHLKMRYGVVLRARTGVSTGEVVASDDPDAEQKLATGDTVNVAARLEQAAPADQIYISELTYQLVRNAAQVERVAPLELKGKSRRVAAFRLLAVHGSEMRTSRNDLPLIGRDAELGQLQTVLRDVIDRRTARLISVIGEAGAGKSRLVRELLERSAGAIRILAGRCLSYGEGITFWPLQMVIRAAASIDDADPPRAAYEKLVAAAGERDIADRLASAAGLNTVAYPLHEIDWATRRFLERLATDRPLLVLFEDIHWAESAFLGLIQHVLQTLAGVPVLILVTARHEFVEERGAWGVDANSVRIVLHPLTREASERMVADLLDSAGISREVLDRIVSAAEGNPLYAEQMLAWLRDSGALRLEDGTWVGAGADQPLAMPPTIQALLEARLDALPRAERATVESASVIGLEFANAAVESLTPPGVRQDLALHLGELTRKRFVQPTESAYRFHHQLVRDTAYHGMLKRVRARLHVQFVRWADEINAGRDRALEFEEILGYHLEQAQRYLRELGPLDAEGLAIGRDAARRLAAAARRVFARGDMHASINLFRRAVALLSELDAERLPLLPELGEALMERGDFAAAQTVLEEAEREAHRSGNRRLMLSAQLMKLRLRLFSAEPEDSGAETLRLTTEAIPLLEADAAYPELARAWRLVGFVHGIAGRYGKSDEAVGRSMVYARRMADQRLIARNAMGLSLSTLYGPTPVPQAIERCESMLADQLVDRQAESKILCTLAQLRAMNGEPAKARELYRRGRSLVRDLGQNVNSASTAIDVLAVEYLAGDLVAAEREIRPDFDFLVRIGEKYHLSSIAALLSRVLRDQGRDDEALANSRIAEEMAAADDVESQALWRSYRAPILARAGDLEGAESLARSAVEFAARTDAPSLQGDTFCDLGLVLAQARRNAEAREAFDSALTLYARKGDVVSVDRVRRLLGGLS